MNISTYVSLLEWAFGIFAIGFLIAFIEHYLRLRNENAKLRLEKETNEIRDRIKNMSLDDMVKLNNSTDGQDPPKG